MQKFIERVTNMSAALESFLAADTTKTVLTELFGQYFDDVHSRAIVSNDVFMSSWDNYILKVAGLCDNVYNVSANRRRPAAM